VGLRTALGLKGRTTARWALGRFRSAPPTSEGGLVAQFTTAPAAMNDAALIARIRQAFTISDQQAGGQSRPDGRWPQIDAMKADVREALLSGTDDEVARLLRHPERTDLLYGFENCAQTLLDRAARSGHDFAGAGRVMEEQFLRLGEACGLRPARSPESARQPPPLDVEALLKSLDDALGFRVDFPNPFGFEMGVPTSRGIASYRAVQALYQVWLLAQHARPGERVLEIGAGLGRTAYYAYRAGFRDYTIIDLPMTNVAQANFLGRVLPASATALASEPQDAPIRIRDVSWRPERCERFAVAINADSLTELDRADAARYVEFVADMEATFISLNHEANSFTARELLLARFPKVTRFRHWLRDGYIVEIAEPARVPMAD